MSAPANLLKYLDDWFPKRALTNEEQAERGALFAAIRDIGEQWACDLWLLDHRQTPGFNWSAIRDHVRETCPGNTGKPKFGETRLAWLERTIGWKPTARGADNPLLLMHFLQYSQRRTKTGERQEQWLARDAWVKHRGQMAAATRRYQARKKRAW